MNNIVTFGLAILIIMILAIIALFMISPRVDKTIELCKEKQGKLIYVGYSKSYNCEFDIK